MIKEALDAHAAKLETKFKHDRSTTVGASEVGQCARKTFFTKHNLVAARGDTKKVKAARPHEEDDDYEHTWGAHLRGTIMENHFWTPALRRRFKHRLLYAGREQRTFAIDCLSATPDGVIVDLPRDALAHLGVPDLEGDCIVADSKTIDPRVNLREAKAENEMQIQVQLGLVRETTNYRPMWGLLSYINASFWDDVKEYPVRFDEARYEKLKERARHIMTAKNFTEFKPEGWIAGGKECGYCPFVGQCDAQRNLVPRGENTRDMQFKQEVTSLAQLARVEKDAEKTAEVQYRTLTEQIKELLRKAGTRIIPGVVSWSDRKGSNSWDMDGLREACLEKGIKIDEFRTEGDPTSMFKVLLK